MRQIVALDGSEREASQAEHRGRERARRPADAVSEFEKIIRQRYICPAAPTIAPAQLGLARAWAAAGDVTRSRQEYEKFFTLWKNADPDVPILVEAKAEYARLGPS